MDLKKEFGTDKSLELEGVWQELGDGASVLVARAGNRNHAEELKRLTAPYRRQISLGKLGAEVWEKISIESMASCVLLDWKGIKDDGKVVPYSQANALRLLTDYPDFRDMISALANEMSAYQQTLIEEEQKN